MLHDIQRRPFLEQPAGKNPPPFLIRLLHLDLHKAAGEVFLLPRRGLLTSLQPDDDLPEARRFSGFQCHVTRHPVALVEQPKHRNPLPHGGGALRACHIFRRGDGDDVNPGLRRVERGVAQRLYRGLRCGLCARP